MIIFNQNSTDILLLPPYSPTIINNCANSINFLPVVGPCMEVSNVAITMLEPMSFGRLLPFGIFPFQSCFDIFPHGIVPHTSPHVPFIVNKLRELGVLQPSSLKLKTSPIRRPSIIAIMKNRKNGMVIRRPGSQDMHRDLLIMRAPFHICHSTIKPLLGERTIGSIVTPSKMGPFIAKITQTVKF
jgi:hypothetical protein